MPIFTGSRYAIGGEAIGVEDADGRLRRFIFTRRKLERSELTEDEFSVYTIKAGDRLDALANKFGGNARQWWIIADINDLVDFPQDLTEGQQLIIPTEEVFRRFG